jgi:hypothetical protein
VSGEPISDAEIARMLELLGRDLARTKAAEHRGAAPKTIQEVRERYQPRPDENMGEMTQRLVEGIQQALLDSDEEILWPPCPRHPAHPLSFRDHAWHCERNNEAFSLLGGLSEIMASVLPDPPPDPPPDPGPRRPRRRRKGKP